MGIKEWPARLQSGRNRRVLTHLPDRTQMNVRITSVLTIYQSGSFSNRTKQTVLYEKIKRNTP